MEVVSSVATTITHFFPLVGGTTVIASAAGIIPRAGPMRAAVIALASLVRKRANPPTVRKNELDILRRSLTGMVSARGSYDVVTGVKGVGKSYLVLSATDRTCCVIQIEATPGMSIDAITNSALRALTTIRLEFVNPGPSARRVIFWYSLFAQRPPVVVIHASERKEGDSFASIGGAARILTDNYGLHVLIDGSPNSLHKELFCTKRENILRIEPFAEDVKWHLPQFKDLLALVKDSVLKQAIWRVLGGVPSDFEKLCRQLQNFDSAEAKQECIKTFLCKEVEESVKSVLEYEIENPRMITVLERFQEDGRVFQEEPYIRLDEVKKFKRPSPDKVLRQINVDGYEALVPASNSLKLVLCHGIKRAPTFEVLLRLLNL